MSRAAVESRRAAIGVAECLVQIKALQGHAEVEQQRLVEQGSTDRCRITEENRSRRFERLADVAKVSVLEGSQTQRAAIASHENVARDSVAASIQIEEHRRGAHASVLGPFGWAALGGATGVLALPRAHAYRSGHHHARASKASRTALRRLIALLLGVLAVRRAWRLWAPEPSQLRRHLLGAAAAALRWSQLCPAPLLALFDIFGGASNGSVDKQPSPLSAEEPAPAAVLAVPASPATVLTATPLDAPTAVRTCRASAPELQLVGETGGAPPHGTAGINSSSSALHHQLEHWGLALYAEDLEERGYDAGVLYMLEQVEVDEMLALINCKSGHRVRFRRMLASQPLAPVASSAIV